MASLRTTNASNIVQRAQEHQLLVISEEVRSMKKYSVIRTIADTGGHVVI